MTIWEALLEGLSTTPWQVGVALLLDLTLGDPRWFPHPAKWTGSMVAPLEKAMVSVLGRTIGAGALFWALITLGQGACLLALAFWLPSQLWWCLETWLIYQCFAAMDMHRHVRAISRPLKAGDLAQARSRLAWIVGRDTETLSETEVSRAAVESVGESACDALIAPLFWTVVGGPVGALVYRAANTLDSMVGHRGERYEKFGKASARMDDVLNWVPARIVALLSSPRKLALVFRESKGHRSPNAGWGESAVAWATGVRLGGTNYYDGKPLESPVFNPAGRAPDLGSIDQSLRWWWRIVISGFLVALGLCFIL